MRHSASNLGSGYPDYEVSLATIALARYRLSKYLQPTPLLEANEFGKRCFFKLECLNKTKSFKVRGALNALLAAREDSQTRSDEFVAASSGNHAQALAYASRILSVQARILVPENTPKHKIESIERFTEPIIFGATYEEAEAEARRIEKEEGIPCISAYNHPDIVSATGTIGLEILDQLPKVERVMVPVGGGALIGGIAMAIKAQNPFTEVIGVCASSAPAMYNIFYNTYYVASNDTLADALSGNIEQNSITIDLVKKYVDKIVLVTEAQIESAVRDVVFNYGFVANVIIVEGGGAAALAAARSVLDMDARPTVIVLTGASISNETLLTVLNKAAPH